MVTATQLFAISRGVLVSRGEYRCFYCGGACDGAILASEHVKDSFTARDTVCGGEYVCVGCVHAMDESADVVLPTGERLSGQKTRRYSWVISDATFAATKSHREWLSHQCQNPPEPPFVICLSDSRRKHLLYRAKVCQSRNPITVTLEGEVITYTIHDLTERLRLCRQLVAATGKPALSEPVSTRFAMSVISYHEDESLVLEWQQVREQPLSRLATWLCPPKEECANEFPASVPADANNRAVQTAFSWTD